MVRDAKAQAERTIANVSTENSALKSKVDEMTSLLKNASDLRRENKSQIEAVTEKHRRLEMENTDLKQTIAELEKALEEVSPVNDVGTKAAPAIDAPQIEVTSHPTPQVRRARRL